MTVKELISTLKQANPEEDVYFWIALHLDDAEQITEPFTERICPISNTRINPVGIYNGVSYRQNCVFLE